MKLDGQDPNFRESDAHAVPVPTARFAGGEGRVDHGADRAPEVVAVDEQAAHAPQRRLGVGLDAAARRGAVSHPLDAHVRPQPEAQQQPAAQRVRRR